MRWLACVVIVFLTVACGEDTSVPPEQPPRAEAVPLVDTPSKVFIECSSHPELKPACPRQVPEVEDVGFQRATASREGNTWVFFAEWNAPRPGIDKRNAPPAFAHVNVLAGALEQRHGFESEDLGERKWGGRSGRLMLAPSYPQGGLEGDHLIFVWSHDDMQYSVSLHAWEPVEETEATLEAMVGSLPAP